MITTLAWWFFCVHNVGTHTHTLILNSYVAKVSNFDRVNCVFVVSAGYVITLVLICSGDMRIAIYYID